jgi:DNA-binding GntR family transcriptional regulator
MAATERVTEPDARRSALLSSLRDGAEADGTALAQRIFEDLAIEIVEGRLPPLEDLNSVDLGRQFSTSRTPVREALLKLEREGLVEIPARRRPYVAPLDVTQARDLYELRVQLSQLVSRQVVERADAAELRTLWAWQERLEEDVAAGHVDDYFWHNVEFRNCETALTRNTDLTRIVRSLGLRTLRFRHLSLSQPGRLARSCADHRRLLLAYEDRDVSLACALTRSLIMGGMRAIERSGMVAAGLGAGRYPTANGQA